MARGHDEGARRGPLATLVRQRASFVSTKMQSHVPREGNDGMGTTVVCWNIATRHQPWRELVRMGADVALLQEARSVPPDVAAEVGTGPPEASRLTAFEQSYDRWPMVVKLSDRVEVEWFRQVGAISEPKEDEIAVSGVGTIAAARIIPRDAPPFIAVSMYAQWIKPHTSAYGTRAYPDGSAHRIISDLTAFIGSTNPATHRILAAGDLNMIFGATDGNPVARPGRDRTVTDRMAALGMEFLGPRAPAGGRQASPTPPGLPSDTANVPTYYHAASETTETASLQLDYAFASRGFHERVAVRALNSGAEWGSSDHSRLLIEIADE